MAEVLTEEYTSSEDTDNEAGNPVYTVRERSWESRKLIKHKKALDKFYVGHQSKRSRESSVKRVRQKMLANWDKPDDCPSMGKFKY